MSTTITAAAATAATAPTNTNTNTNLNVPPSGMSEDEDEREMPAAAAAATRVGFIGLGNMGAPMALNLRRKLAARGAVLYVYDVAPGAVDGFLARCAQEGFRVAGADATEGEGEGGVQVQACASCREVGRHSDVTFVIVPEGRHVRAVFCDPDTGLLAGAGSTSESAAKKTYVDCSTIDIATAREVAAAVSRAQRDARFYDAPVSGGTGGAARGTLTFMCGAADAEAEGEGGDAHFAQHVTPLLRTMGASVFCLGRGAGRGLAAKLANNYLSGVVAIATSEAMNLGMRLGVDAVLLHRVFGRSSGANWVNETTNPVPGVCPDAVTSHGYRGGFKVQLMRKDVGLAVAAAAGVGARLVLGDAALATYAAAADDARCRDLDARVVYRWLGGIEPGRAEEDGEENA